MLYTDKVKEIEQKLGIDAKKLPNNLLTTHLCAICDCLSDSGGGIVDVDELPDKWIGTPLPSKYVGKVYFNTNLSGEEVNSLITKVVPVEKFFLGEYSVYSVEKEEPYTFPIGTIVVERIYLKQEENTSHSIMFAVTKRYSNYTNRNTHTIFSSGQWDNQYSEIELTVSLEQTEFLDRDNSNFSSLISITPFKKVDSNAIYRLPNGTLWIFNNDEWMELATKNNSGIVDVEELPAKWTGTPIPENHTGKVYFNTNLSVDEVNELIEQNVDLSSGRKFIYYCTTPYNVLADGYEYISFEKLNGINHIIWFSAAPGVATFANETIFKEGWNASQIELYLTKNYEGVRFSSQGVDSTLLSSLISTTPFKKVDPNAIYRLPDGTLWMYHNDEWKELTTKNNSGIVDVEVLPNGWKGTPVPNSGFYEKIYINTNLNGAEVNKLISNCVFDEYNYRTVFCDIDGSRNLEVWKDGKISVDFGLTIFENGSWDKPLPIENPMIMEYELSSNVELIDNKKLSSLVSITPFEEEPINTNSIYRLPDGTLWMYHNNEWKELSFGGSGGSAGVQLKLVETVGDSNSNILNSDSISLTKKLKPNAIYYIKYNTPFGYEFGTNLFTYIYADTDIVQGCSNMMVAEGDDEERACGYFFYECNNSVNTLIFKGQIPADSLSGIYKLEIYELTSSATQTEDEVITISGDTDYYKEDEDCVYFDLSKKGNYRVTNLTDNDIPTGLFQLDFGYSKAFPTVGKALVSVNGFNQTFSNFDAYIFGCPNYESFVSHGAFAEGTDIYIQVTDDTVLVFGHLEG